MTGLFVGTIYMGNAPKKHMAKGHNYPCHPVYGKCDVLMWRAEENEWWIDLLNGNGRTSYRIDDYDWVELCELGTPTELEIQTAKKLECLEQFRLEVNNLLEKLKNIIEDYLRKQGNFGAPGKQGKGQ